MLGFWEGVYFFVCVCCFFFKSFLSKQGISAKLSRVIPMCGIGSLSSYSMLKQFQLWKFQMMLLGLKNLANKL